MRLCDICRKAENTQRPLDELKWAKQVVMEWEPHPECGHALGHTFLSKLHAMRSIADNCAYWRTAYGREYKAQTNWEHKAFIRYRRFIQFKFNKPAT